MTKTKTLTIDTDAAPVLPEWATLEEHKGVGKVAWEPQQFDLYLIEEQKTGYIKGHTLREKLKYELVMNVNVANFLVAHPELYPEAWKGKFVYFWGTVIRDRDGYLLVPCLYENDGQVYLYWRWLVNDWSHVGPALRFARKSSGLSPSALPSYSLDFSALEERVATLEAFEKQVRGFLILPSSDTEHE